VPLGEPEVERDVREFALADLDKRSHRRAVVVGLVFFFAAYAIALNSLNRPIEEVVGLSYLDSWRFKRFLLRIVVVASLVIGLCLARVRRSSTRVSEMSLPEVLDWLKVRVE
jgi:hypothetical protein